MSAQAEGAATPPHLAERALPDLLRQLQLVGAARRGADADGAAHVLDAGWGGGGGGGGGVGWGGEIGRSQV
jgi:hypothetical protein